MNRFRSSLNYICRKLTQKWILLVASGVVAALSWIAVFASAQSNELKVYFFDVGQGDAIFIELQDGKQILIDGGPNDKVVEKLNSVMPFWDRSIDIVIATHGEADHIAGLISVLDHYNVEAIIWNGVETETKVFQEFQGAMVSEGAEIIAGKCCARFMLAEDAFFEILYPFDAPWFDSAKLSQNELSLIIRFVYGDESFLFSGDIERHGEYEILKAGFNIESDILKVAHHGSKTSSSELFLERVNPKMAIISSGRSNTYGHPHDAILQRLAKYGIEIRRTDEEGNILIIK